jgi:Nucleotidyltransferase domain
MSVALLPAFLNRWPGMDAAAQSRQWPRIVDLAERVEGAAELTGLLLLGSFARGESDSLSDVDFIVVVEPDWFDEAWARRHQLHPDADVCWDYPRPEEREVAAHRWLTPELVLFDGLITTQTGARVADPLVVLVGERGLAERMTRFDPTAEPGAEVELNEVERLYGQLKLAARAAREA